MCGHSGSCPAQINTPHPVSYLVTVEVKGQDHVQTGDNKLGLIDWEFGTSAGKLGTIKYGKIKEPFVYEMVGDTTLEDRFRLWPHGSQQDRSVRRN